MVLANRSTISEMCTERGKGAVTGQLGKQGEKADRPISEQLCRGSGRHRLRTTDQVRRALSLGIGYLTSYGGKRPRALR